MDALILSCGTGGGHDSAAKAIMEEMCIRGHTATMLNPYTLCSEELAQKVNNTYVTMVQNRPHLFGALYSAGQIYRKLPGKSPVYYINRRMIPIMKNYLSNHSYDVIIITHLYAAEIITNLKDSNIQIPKTIYVSTDYVCIPFTEETSCDAYIIPANDLVPDYVGLGIPKEKLYPFGIPTNRSFSKVESKEDARRRLNLDMHKKYILVAGGSMGGGSIRKTIDVLVDNVSSQQDVALIIVCGNNKKLYADVGSKQSESIVLLGYTDDMAGYLRASDVFITKPGGLSSTEAAVCGIPILHTAGIPGCETYNREYFHAHGMSVMCNNPKEIMQKAAELVFNEEKSAEMVKCQQSKINKLAAANICTYAEDSSAAIGNK